MNFVYVHPPTIHVLIKLLGKQSSKDYMIEYG